MEIIENQSTPFWLLHDPRGRRLFVSLLKLEPAALTGTRFQFLRNHPLIRDEMECPSLPRTKAFEVSGRGKFERHAVLEFLKCLLRKKTAPKGD
ncbi:hypothetical protein SAMN05216464_111124 [Mucilaginibacter pineti]|uniref:Uncharacterized protein n=1 Tax=Mucilaginibacter pineti TaxID=1391627 RepID=A0A1G7H9B2_9SPHI|nr:hypothetical protein [Mucilaginibacter pineti]SDE97012.1 hypothetical protein SAMN05216464_111124 [Mucilaginibacter pineti]